MTQANQEQERLMLGNEAVARGAWEAGVKVVSSYPGTPSTEVTEAIAQYPDVYAEWAPNEKVALEVAAGASLGGARALSCMKHVGLNVAADPLFTASYTGVNGGLVVLVADDPGMHSSQNEQDSRFYARSAHIPMLEPSDSQEALDLMRRAFDLSEAYDTPILLRMTTRISHAQSVVVPGQRQDVAVKPYQKDVMKYVMMPGMARKRHVAVEARMNRLIEDLPTLSLYREEMADTTLGVLCSGTCYQYVKEALPNASVFKLDMVYPLPLDAIRDFSNRVEKLIVVEELEPFFEQALLAAGIPCTGKALTGLQGELGAAKVALHFATGDAVRTEDMTLAQRPPVLCPGCPHRAVFHTLKKMRVTVTGDIGCYTLGALAPLGALDSVLCMGASVGMAHGFEKARGQETARNTVAVIGDSTFLHSGMTGLLNTIYNGGTGTLVILDNRTTGMTGHQQHPGTGKTLMGDPAPAVDLEALVRALGVSSVAVVDPFDLPALEKALKEAVALEEPSVVIARRPCALLIKEKQPVFYVETEKCRNCSACMRFGCPAIEKGEHAVRINAALCNGCGLCQSACRFGALQQEGQ